MNELSQHQIGIIGFGNFGSYLAGLLPPDAKKIAHDLEGKTSDVENLQFVRLHELLQNADIIFLAVPLSSYEDLLPQLKGSSALVVDLASVKVQPAALFKKHLLPDQEVLLAHPLFGPESAQQGLDGHKLIVTAKQGQRAEQVVRHFKRLGAEVVETSAEEHDKQMAYTHVLTFFISRALLKMNIRDVELSAPSFQKLLALEELESHHSDELFKTIQQGNPYGDSVRQELIKTLARLEDEIRQ